MRSLRLAAVLGLIATATACYPFILDPFRESGESFERDTGTEPDDTGSTVELCFDCFEPLWLNLAIALPIDPAARKTFYVEGSAYGYATVTLFEAAYFDEEDHSALCDLFYVAQEPIDEAEWAATQGRWFGVQLDSRWVLDPGSPCLSETFDPAAVDTDLFEDFGSWGYSYSLGPLTDNAIEGLVMAVGQETYDNQWAPHLIGGGHSTVAGDPGYIEDKYVWMYEVDGETLVTDTDGAQVPLFNEGVDRNNLPRAMYVLQGTFVIEGGDRIFAP